MNAAAKQQLVLRRIVALKRQSAEQRVRALQLDAGRIEAEIAALGSDLTAMDALPAGFDAHRMSEASGHVRKLLADIAAARSRLALKQAELQEARDALKRALHSEERLGSAS